MCSGTSSLLISTDTDAYRPGFCSSGSEYLVSTNHYKVTALPSATVQQWDVKVEGDDAILSDERELSKAKKAAQMRFKRGLLAFPEVREKLGKGCFIYDGGAIAWSVGAPFQSLSQEVSWKRGDTTSTCTLYFTKTTSIDLKVVHQYLEKKFAYGDSIIQCMTLIDALLAEGPKNKFAITPNTNMYFDRANPDNVIPIGGGVELLRGIFQSARPALGTMTVNLDVAHTAFWQPDITVAELLVANLNLSSEAQLANLNPRQASTAKKILRGLSIYTRHTETRNKSFRAEKACQLAKETARTKKFNKDGSVITLAQYFKSQYRIDLKQQNAPLLELLGMMKNAAAGTDARRLLPLELCYVHQGNKVPLLQLSGQQTAEIVKHAAKPPADRLKQIQANQRALDWDNDATLKHFGLSISGQPMQAKARLLPAPELKYSSSVRPRDGKWMTKGQKLLGPSQLNCWGVFGVDTRERNLDAFIKEFVGSATRFGLKVGAPKPYIEERLRDGDVRQVIMEAATKTARNFGGKKPDLLVFIVRNSPCPELYGIIKRVCDVELGVPSQVVAGKSVSKANSQLTDNIMLKVNPKLGGKNSELARNPFSKP